MTSATSTQADHAYEAACDAADDYLESIGLRGLVEVDPKARLLLARALINELPKLETIGQPAFKAARTNLFDVIQNAFDSFDGDTADLPTAPDLAERLQRIGCSDQARPAFESIIARLIEDKID